MSNAVESIDQTGPVEEISLKDIMRLIPHRYPMLLVDKVVDVTPAERAVGIKNVTINEPFFQGHFPTRPVMPGVLLLEAMAQTAGILVMHTLNKYDQGTLVYFMSIDDAKFRKMVEPGDVVHFEVVKMHQRGPVWKFKCRALVDGEVVAEAIETAMIDDRAKKGA